MIRALSTLAVFAGLTSAALAQTTPPPAPTPEVPTLAQCNEGYKDGMTWTKEQFEQACLKVRAGNQGK